MPVHPFSFCYSCPAEQVTDRSLGTRLKKRQNLMKSMLLKKTSNNNKLNYKNRTKTKQNKDTKKRVSILYKNTIVLHVQFGLPLDFRSP